MQRSQRSFWKGTKRWDHKCLFIHREYEEVPLQRESNRITISLLRTPLNLHAIKANSSFSNGEKALPSSRQTNNSLSRAPFGHHWASSSVLVAVVAPRSLRREKGRRCCCTVATAMTLITEIVTKLLPFFFSSDIARKESSGHFSLLGSCNTSRAIFCGEGGTFLFGPLFLLSAVKKLRYIACFPALWPTSLEFVQPKESVPPNTCNTKQQPHSTADPTYKCRAARWELTLRNFRVQK